MRDEKHDAVNEVFDEIETIFKEIEKCARKMKNASKYIDFFVGDILDYSVLNKADENFKK